MQRIALSTLLTLFTVATATAGPLALNSGSYPDGSSPCAGWNFARSLSDPHRPTPAPAVRVAQGPGMGGGFLEKLFGGPGSRRRRPTRPRRCNAQVRPAPGYETQVAHPAVSPRFMKQEVSYDGREAPGTIIINTRERLLYLVQENGRAHPLRHRRGPAGLHLGRHAPRHAEARMAGLDAARARCSSAGPICRATWRAASTIRSARAPCISARRSTASTARTSPGPSVRRYRRAASACATRTSSTSISKVKVGTKVIVI